MVPTSTSGDTSIATNHQQALNARHLYSNRGPIYSIFEKKPESFQEDSSTMHPVETGLDTDGGYMQNFMMLKERKEALLRSSELRPSQNKFQVVDTA